MNQGGASHQGQNQYPLRFPLSYPNHGFLAQPASASAHQAPASSPQSALEDTLFTLNIFIQSNGQMAQELRNSTMINSQAIQEVKNATMVNTQAISKLEMQMG